MAGRASEGQAAALRPGRGPDQARRGRRSGRAAALGGRRRGGLSGWAAALEEPGRINGGLTAGWSGGRYLPPVQLAVRSRPTTARWPGLLPPVQTAIGCQPGAHSSYRRFIWRYLPAAW